jgi:hypothetical protein
LNRQAKRWYQSSLYDFHAGHYKQAYQKAKKCIPLLTDLLTEEEYNWLCLIHNYNSHFDIANKRYEQEYYNDALTYYASLDFNGAPELILERLKICRQKAIYPLLRNTNVGAEESFQDKEQLFPIKQDGKWGYVNEKNEVIIPFKYDYISSIQMGMIWVELNEEEFVINEKEIIIYDIKN